MKYYIIEVRESTNNPGDWVTKIIFDNRQSAEEALNTYIDEDAEVVDDNEWDDKGPNWKRLKTIAVDDTIITLDEVDNEQAEEI